MAITNQEDESEMLFEWTGPFGYTATGKSIWVTTPGMYIVTASSSTTCSAVDTAIVYLSDKPDIHVVADGLVPCDSSGVQIFATSMNPNVTYYWIGPDGTKYYEQNPIIYIAGIYTVVVTDTVGNCYDKKILELEWECCNLIDGGLIMSDEEYCDAFDPEIIVEVIAPFGGNELVAIEYIWMKTTDPTLPVMQWEPIFEANQASYDPGPVDITTYFVRCARRRGCIDYVESNTVVKRVAQTNAIVDSIQVVHESDCDAENGAILIPVDNHDFGPYMVKVTYNEVETLYFGEFLDSVIVLSGLRPGDYQDIIIRNARGCLSDTIAGPFTVEEFDCDPQQLSSSEAQVNTYPNPTASFVNIDYKPSDKDNIVSFEIVDMTGTVITSIKRDVSNQIEVNERISLDNVNSGMYYVRIIGNDSIKYIPIEIVK